MDHPAGDPTRAATGEGAGPPAPPDPLRPEAALATVAALPPDARPQVLLRLAEDLERRLDAGETGADGPEQPPGR